MLVNSRNVGLICYQRLQLTWLAVTISIFDYNNKPTRNKNVHTIPVYIYNVFCILNPWRHNSDGANRRTKDLVTSYCGYVVPRYHGQGRWTLAITTPCSPGTSGKFWKSWCDVGQLYLYLSRCLLKSCIFSIYSNKRCDYTTYLIMVKYYIINYKRMYARSTKLSGRAERLKGCACRWSYLSCSKQREAATPAHRLVTYSATAAALMENSLVSIPSRVILELGKEDMGQVLNSKYARISILLYVLCNIFFTLAIMSIKNYDIYFTSAQCPGLIVHRDIGVNCEDNILNVMAKTSRKLDLVS
ncbi:hypothetical protein QTP88_009240 [Uroleucon formosanum]